MNVVGAAVCCDVCNASTLTVMVLCVFVWGAGTSPQLCWCQRCALSATLSLAMTCRHRSVCWLLLWLNC
jgi:hypothetical protein